MFVSTYKYQKREKVNKIQGVKTRKTDRKDFFEDLQIPYMSF